MQCFSGQHTKISIVALILLASVPAAFATEKHFEKVKFSLVSLYIRCTTCHTNEAGEGFTIYGQKIADLGKRESVQQRVQTMERRVSDIALNMDPNADRDRIDLDGDGALNWVEILCQTDPSDPKSVPPLPKNKTDPPTLRFRVESVIDCRLCHTGTSTELSEDHAPHNAFGKALSKLANRLPSSTRRSSRSRGQGRSTESPKKDDILLRVKKLSLSDLDHDKVPNWAEIVAFHHPANREDTPTAEEAKAAKQRILAGIRHKIGFGKAHLAK